MSQAPWMPSCSHTLLKARAQLFKDLRSFFAERNVLEVETPLLCAHTVTDCHIESFSVEKRYLQTSPEYAMKRLLASGSGAIYQITKAFRATEYGEQHNPEFTLLEWYEPDASYHDLMQLLETLLLTILPYTKIEKKTFRDVFIDFLNIDPFACDTSLLKQILTTKGYAFSAKTVDDTPRNTLLQWLFSTAIEPHLGHEAPLYLYDFPVEQAALATIRAGIPPVAERFELFIAGKEIANGFQELQSPEEQEGRFQKDQKERQLAGKSPVAIDTLLLSALKNGLPSCSGVAVGLDRLLMIQQSAQCLSEVLSFDWNRA